MGRATNYTEELAETICGRIASGESLKAICRDQAMPDNSTVLRWVGDRPEFQKLYASAMQARFDAWAEDVITIADGEEASPDAVQRDRLKIDTRKWLMARGAPKKYGDRLDMNVAPDASVNQRFDLSGLTRPERDQLRGLLELNNERLAARAIAQPSPGQSLRPLRLGLQHSHLGQDSVSRQVPMSDAR